MPGNLSAPAGPAERPVPRRPALRGGFTGSLNTGSGSERPMARTALHPRKPAVGRKAPPLRKEPRPPRVARVDLAEDPHAHVVCRVCGRIQRIELTELDRLLLTQLAERHPDGWSVDGVAFSLTGACQRCREGPSTR
jgi:hypothetical protein